jgi:GNAT superfamily N-acetyltransferase
MTPARVEPAQAHEVATVLALIEALLAELGDEGQEFTQIDRDKVERDLAQEMAATAEPNSGRFLALLARDESGVAIGVLTISTGFAIYAGGEYGVIDEMYVRPEYRSLGIGRQLVEAALDIARQRGWFRLDVTGPVGAGGDSSADCRAAAKTAADSALRFYRRLGFEPTGQRLRLLV